jgi:4'-phosphopantetheinyl transferase EntD
MIPFVELPSSVHLAWAPITDQTHDLLGDEVHYAMTMVARRRHAFAAGRRAAREALAMLGRPSVAISRTEDRAPVWPPAVIGAITHTDRWAGAVVADAGSALGLGLDLEEIARIGDDVAERICTANEWSVLRVLPPAARQQRAAVIFAAKECVHKAWSPRGRSMLPFDAVEIAPDPSGRFTVRPLDARLRTLPEPCWRGLWATHDGMAAAFLQLTPAGGAEG